MALNMNRDQIRCLIIGVSGIGELSIHHVVKLHDIFFHISWRSNMGEITAMGASFLQGFILIFFEQLRLLVESRLFIRGIKINPFLFFSDEMHIWCLSWLDKWISLYYAFPLPSFRWISSLHWSERDPATKPHRLRRAWRAMYSQGDLNSWALGSQFQGQMWSSLLPSFLLFEVERRIPLWLCPLRGRVCSRNMDVRIALDHCSWWL